LLKKLSGNAIVTGFTVNSSMDGMIEGSISFQGSGAVAYSAT
jgi:predicted secreted protein